MLATTEMQNSFSDLLSISQSDPANLFKAILRHASSMTANLAIMSELTTKRGTDHLARLAQTFSYELARVAKKVYYCFIHRLKTRFRLVAVIRPLRRLMTSTRHLLFRNIICQNKFNHNRTRTLLWTNFVN